VSTAPAQVESGQLVVLDGVDWLTYSRLLRVFAERRAIRLTYDRGRLEIMSPPCGFMGTGYRLGRFVDTLTEECGLPVQCGGSTTLRRRRKRRGLEPDNYFWIAHAIEIRGKRDVDLRKDPPPDLAIEVGVTRSSLDRMGIYAALGVPEVWRPEGRTVSFHLLGANRAYEAGTQSRTFPWLSSSDLSRFLALHDSEDMNAIGRQSRNWVRQRPADAQTETPKSS
jgi:Uma2 family endonuclease